ncbi:MAG: preprotein translocase subunit SecY [Maribacter sp.]|jgi:preprotein translocase subunit SecY
MKKLFTTLRNIWSIEDLRKRIIFTLGLLLVYRLGSFVVLPGVNGQVLNSVIEANSNGNDIIALINAFTGGAFTQASVFALGIMPYISASIIVQLLGFAVPYFQRLQKTEGEAGRKKITQITRMLTVLITLVQGGGYLTAVRGWDVQAQQNALGSVISESLPDSIFWISGIVILSTGTIFAMWLGEKITDRGIGNGVSILITIGIIAALPGAFASEVIAKLGFPMLIELAIFVAIIMVTVMLVQGIRKIPIQYAKRAMGRKGAMVPTAGQRDNIPLKVIAAGVMPIIFAQALMFLPATVYQYMSGTEAAAAGGLLQSLTDFMSLPYNIIYFLLVVLFTYVYTALIVNPKDYAEYLKRNNAFIPGIKPGEKTAEYIDAVVTRITLPGSVFLGIISIFPAIVAAFGVQVGFAMFFGGTSLLIIVGVVLDTLQQIESHLVMRKYDGLVKSGKLRSRSGMQGIGASM